MKLEKIKLVEMVDDGLTKRELKLLIGGYEVNGCNSYVCNGSSYEEKKKNCTNGDGICKSKPKA